VGLCNTMAGLIDFLGIGPLFHRLAVCSPSAALKLRRVGRSCMNSSQILEAARLGAQPSREAPASEAGAKLRLLAMDSDSPDEVLVALLPWVSTPTTLIAAAANRNFVQTCSLLYSLGADLGCVEMRRGRRWGLVDLAARAASFDNDWRLVLLLMQLGCRPESPGALLQAPLRRGDVELAKQLLRSVEIHADSLVQLLCDVCAYGATNSAALLIDDVKVPVNARSQQGENCVDAALAWHCWETVDWLVSQRGGTPSNSCTALGDLLDARRDPHAACLFTKLRSIGCFPARDLLMAAACKGDKELLADVLVGRSSALRAPLVDLALCHGQLDAALWLLQQGLEVQDATQAKADAQLYGRSHPALAAKVLGAMDACCREVTGEDVKKSQSILDGDIAFGIQAEMQFRIACPKTQTGYGNF